jgi:PAS domain S-box-containing protein
VLSELIRVLKVIFVDSQQIFDLEAQHQFVLVLQYTSTNGCDSDAPSLLRQIDSLCQMSETLNQTLDLQGVLALVFDKMLAVVPYNSAQFYLLDLLPEHFFVNQLQQENQPIPIQKLLNFPSLEVLANGQIQIQVTGTNQTTVTVPVMYQGGIVGVYVILTSQPPSVIETLKSFIIVVSNLIAIAIGNAVRYSEQIERARLLRTQADQLRLLFEIAANTRSDLPLTENLETIAYGIQEALGYQIVLIATFDSTVEWYQHVTSVGLPVNSWERLQQLPLTKDEVNLILLPKYKVSKSYVVPTSRSIPILKELKRLFKLPGTGQFRQKPPHPFIFVPLQGGREQFLGLLVVDNPTQSVTPNRATIEILEIFANQAALAIENAKLFAATEQKAQQLESSFSTLQRSYRELDRVSQNLAEKERENQALLADLNQRVLARTADLAQERDRNLILLRITSELSSSLDLESVLFQALAMVKEAIDAKQGSIYFLDPASDQIIHRAALGNESPLPSGGQVIPFHRGDGLVGWVVEHCKPVVIDQLTEDPRWVVRLPPNRHQSALGVPLLANEDVLGALMFFSDRPAAFSSEQLDLVTAAANQVASAINNAELYRLIRDQAERLGSMLRQQQFEASKSRAILEAVADGVMVTDQKGAVVLFNRSAERILHLQRGSILGHHVSDFIGLYGRGGLSWLQAIQTWTQGAHTHAAGDFWVDRMVLDDNRIISIHLTPVLDQTEIFLGSVSLFRDITRDVELDRLKSEFVANVSHELRTPMTAIKGYTDLLLMGVVGTLNAEQTKFMDTIRSNVDRLKMLVEDLLDISRIESGKVELDFSEVDLADIFDHVCKHLAGRISNTQRPMHIINEITSSLPKIHGDRRRLLQIFTNLADNAYNYSPADGTICFRATVQPDAIQVDVQDTGIGLSVEERKRIFERFFRGEDALVLASAGTGLGLSIVQRLVEMHSGHLWVESAGRGLGSTFSVLLPTVTK